jgi:predicted nucleic-acid-binding protein
MRAIDTNVLVRLITNDPVEQVQAAERFVEPGAWVPLLVTIEAIWVLESVYRFTRARVVTILEMLLESDRLVFEAHEVIRKALLDSEEKPAIQIADAIILESVRRAGHTPLGTFDRKLGSRKGAVRL